MRWISIFVLSVLSLNHCLPIQASILNFGGYSKSDCGECGSASNCKPVICRPMQTTVFNYQRKYSNTCGGCAGTSASFVADGSCCERTCCAPIGCSPIGCGPRAESTCCAPALCSTPTGTMCDATNCAPAVCGSEGCTTNSCCTCGNDCHDAQSCKIIAQLIHQSTVGCYATERRRAIHRLSDHFDSCCHPEIMNALIYALNDSDERVRAKAADEIGDQVRRNRCICGAPVIRALRCALADCDRNVRKEAESALKLCGFKIVDGQCSGSCGDGYCPASYATTANAELSGQPQSVPVHPAASTTQLPALMVVDVEPPTIPAPAPAPEPEDYAYAKAESQSASVVYDLDANPAVSTLVEDTPPLPAAATTTEMRSFFRTRLPEITKTSGDSKY